MSIYVQPKHRQNLINYWRQFYPKWKIPTGYHVHHIKPRCIGGTDHPRNLIALHPDDHKTIHKLRGDTWVTDSFLNIMGYIKTPEQKENHRKYMIKFNETKRLPKETRIYTCSYCGEPVLKEEFVHYSRQKYYYCDIACKNRFVFTKPSCKSPTPWNKRIKKPRVAWNKGLKNPLSAENARKGAKKLSQTITGRRRVIRDGQKRWAYPTDQDYPGV